MIFVHEIQVAVETVPICCGFPCRCLAPASVATAIAGVFAIFANKIDEITEKLEDVDKAKSRGVSCQH
jgi:hypothetical protein